jgi:hypothetical protein
MPRELLATYEGLHVSAICTARRFVDDAQNLCAHFVNHVLGVSAPLTCGELGALARPPISECTKRLRSFLRVTSSSAHALAE